MNFDEVLEQIGPFGKYQRRMFMLVTLPAVVIAFHQLGSVFLAATPEFSCDTSHPEYTNISFVPYNGTDGCEVPIYTHDSNGTVGTTEMKCHHYTYSTEYFYSTIVTEWDLVCDDKIKSTMSTTVYMLGKLFGAIILGLLSDVLGRKKTAMIGIFMVTSCGVAAAFSPNYYVFVVLRFLVGSCATGLYMCLFVLGMELLGKSYRIVAAITLCYFFALGYVVLAGIAYLSRNWVYTQLAISAPAALFLSYYWLMPESARWLMSRNRREEAMQIITKAAKTNGVQLPADFNLEQETAKPTASIKELCTARTLLCRTLIIFLNWMSVSMGYYGLSLNSGSLKGSIYMNFLLSGGIEFVSYTACFSISKLGRKGPHVFSMLVAGFACLGTILIDQFAKDRSEDEQNIYFVAMNVTGKFGMTMGYSIIYIWSAEIYPTTMRTSLMGMSSLMARIGSVIAPIIADLGMYVPVEYSKIIPSAIMGILVMVAGLLSIALPETTGIDLPETVEEANNLGSLKQLSYSIDKSGSMVGYDNEVVKESST